jgi:hypothetical protein
MHQHLSPCNIQRHLFFFYVHMVTVKPLVLSLVAESRQVLGCTCRATSSNTSSESRSCMRWRAFFFGGCAARRRFDLLLLIFNKK